MRHFLTLKDFSKKEILEIIDLAIKIKKQAKKGKFKPYLENQRFASLFLPLVPSKPKCPWSLP